MDYKRTEEQTIVYDRNDILSWVKQFASRQFGVTADEITEEVMSEIPLDFTISVKHSKTSSNNKEEGGGEK